MITEELTGASKELEQPSVAELMAKKERLLESEEGKSLLLRFDGIISKEEAKKLNIELLVRLIETERYSSVNAYSEKVAIAIGNILQYINSKEEIESGFKTGEKQIKEIQRGSLIHDIGKAGPVSADTEKGRKAILSLFAAENLTQEDKDRTIENAITEVLFIDNEKEAKDVILSLKDSGVDVQMFMWEFWGKHDDWGKEFINRYGEGLTEEEKDIIRWHHAEKGPRGAIVVGKLEEYAYSLGIKAISVVDKYEAEITRSRTEHEEAIRKVEERLKGTPLEKDSFINFLFKTMREMGPGQIFKKNNKI